MVKHSIKLDENPNNFIDLISILNILWNGKRVLISVTVLFSLIGVFYSLSLPNIYKSKAILNPVQAQNSLNQSMSNYSGIASLAGINIGSSTYEDVATQAIEKLHSLSFFKENIIPNIFLPDLMALESWDFKTNTISYKKDQYDEESQTWIRKFAYPQTQIPSVQESYNVFLQKHLKYNKDVETGFVSISIEHQSPYVAHLWTNLIISKINEYYRTKDKQESERAIAYLNEQILKTQFDEIRNLIANLLQQKIQQLTLIEVSEFYVFEYIDPPEVMEKKHKPVRSIICILASLLGGIIGIIIVFVTHFYKRR